MALQTLTQIKQWFKKGLKPTESQFWDTWDSFWHKDEKIPMSVIEGLNDTLNTKGDTTAFTNLSQEINNRFGDLRNEIDIALDEMERTGQFPPVTDFLQLREPIIELIQFLPTTASSPADLDITGYFEQHYSDVPEENRAFPFTAHLRGITSWTSTNRPAYMGNHYGFKIEQGSEIRFDYLSSISDFQIGYTNPTGDPRTLTVYFDEDGTLVPQATIELAQDTDFHFTDPIELGSGAVVVKLTDGGSLNVWTFKMTAEHDVPAYITDENRLQENEDNFFAFHQTEGDSVAVVTPAGLKYLPVRHKMKFVNQQDGIEYIYNEPFFEKYYDADNLYKVGIEAGDDDFIIESAFNAETNKQQFEIRGNHLVHDVESSDEAQVEEYDTNDLIDGAPFDGINNEIPLSDVKRLICANNGEEYKLYAQIVSADYSTNESGEFNIWNEWAYNTKPFGQDYLISDKLIVAPDELGLFMYDYQNNFASSAGPKTINGIWNNPAFGGDGNFYVVGNPSDSNVYAYKIPNEPVTADQQPITVAWTSDNISSFPKVNNKYACQPAILNGNVLMFGTNNVRRINATLAVPVLGSSWNSNSVYQFTALRKFFNIGTSLFMVSDSRIVEITITTANANNANPPTPTQRVGFMSSETAIDACQTDGKLFILLNSGRVVKYDPAVSATEIIDVAECVGATALLPVGNIENIAVVYGDASSASATERTEIIETIYNTILFEVAYSVTGIHFENGKYVFYNGTLYRYELTAGGKEKKYVRTNKSTWEELDFSAVLNTTSDYLPVNDGSAFVDSPIKRMVRSTGGYETIVEKGVSRDTDEVLTVEGKVKAAKLHLGAASSDSYVLDTKQQEFTQSDGTTKMAAAARIQDSLLVENTGSIDKGKPTLQVKKGRIDFSDTDPNISSASKQNEMSIKNTGTTLRLKSPQKIDIIGGKETSTQGEEVYDKKNLVLKGGLDNKGTLIVGDYLTPNWEEDNPRESNNKIGFQVINGESSFNDAVRLAHDLKFDITTYNDRVYKHRLLAGNNLAAEIDDEIDFKSSYTKIDGQSIQGKGEKGAAYGYAPLDANKLVPKENLPQFAPQDMSGLIPKSDFSVPESNRIVRNVQINQTPFNVIIETPATCYVNGVATQNTTNAYISAATTAMAGIMTAADKAKLDGIEAGAQVNRPMPEKMLLKDESGLMNFDWDNYPDSIDIPFNFANGNLAVTTEMNENGGYPELNIVISNEQVGDVRYLILKNLNDSYGFNLDHLRINDVYYTELNEYDNWKPNRNSLDTDVIGSPSYSVLKFTNFGGTMKFIDLEVYYFNR